jgi:hypothetical protein
MSGFKECAKIIKEESENVVYVNPGEKILGARLIGIPPIPIGLNPKKKTIIISYTKPCHGTAAIEIPIKDEDIDNIKKVAISKDK